MIINKRFPINTYVQNNAGRILRAGLFLVATWSCGVAIGEGYEIDYGKSVPQCEYLAKALVEAGVGNMSDDQFCRVQNDSINKWLNAKHIEDLTWRPYPTNDPLRLAKSMVQSTIADKDLPRFSQGIDNSMEVFKKLSSSNNLYFDTAALKLPGKDLYVLQARQESCPNVNGWSDTWLGNGVFLDAGLQHGVKNAFLVPGRFVYFFGNPAIIKILRSAANAEHQSVTTVQLGRVNWDQKVAGVGTIKLCTVSTTKHVAIGK